VQCRAQLAVRSRHVCLLALLLCLVAGVAQARDRDSGLQPAVRIPVEPLGYRPPGRLYLLARYSSSSLDFLDPTHLLLTFRQPRLLLRQEGSNGLDQVIKAAVLELPTGKVVAEDQWLLHDRDRYLWRLADGKILLRIGSHLFEADSKLHLRPMFESPTELENVETSPDGKLLVLQTELEKHTPEEHERLVKHAAQVGTSPPAEDVQIRMVRLDQAKLMLNARANAAGEMPATVNGFFTHEQFKENVWNVRFHPYEKVEPTGGAIVAQVESTCDPSEKVLNEHSVLVLSCPRGHNDRFVAAYSLENRKLWDGRWQSNFTWPSFRMAQDGTSVAISWLAVNHPVSAREPINDEDVQNQVLSVLDSHTGSLRIALLIKPIVSAGGNFALSPDGNRLAVLNHGAIEVYDLPAPPPPPTERAAK
jgi:WD40 repeat protein